LVKKLIALAGGLDLGVNAESRNIRLGKLLHQLGTNVSTGLSFKSVLYFRETSSGGFGEQLPRWEWWEWWEFPR